MSEVVVITGTTHGIGRVTARELVRAGRTVVMLCRDVSAGAVVRGEILRELPHGAVHIVPCDLASLGSFATNHLGPFLLTALLFDRLTSTARIVNLASRAHCRGRMDLEAIADRGARYRSVAAYARSKLANVLYTFALARRLSGTAICANCLHPGVVATNLLPRWLRIVKPLFSDVIDVERGARTTLHLALSRSIDGVSGRYFDEHQNPTPASPLAADVQVQESLWRMSALWTGAPEIGMAAPRITIPDVSSEHQPRAQHRLGGIN